MSPIITNNSSQPTASLPESQPLQAGVAGVAGVTAADYHMGSPVYARGSEKLGCLLYVVASLEAPHTVKQLVVDCGSRIEYDVAVPVESVLSSNKSGIRLALLKSEFEELPEFAEGRFFARHREYRDSAPSSSVPSKRHNNRRPNSNRRPHYGRSGQGRM